MLASPLVRHTKKWRSMEEGLSLGQARMSQHYQGSWEDVREYAQERPSGNILTAQVGTVGVPSSRSPVKLTSTVHHCPALHALLILVASQPLWASRLPRPCFTKKPKLMADGCRSTKTQSLCREGPFLLKSLSLESGCRWGFTSNHTPAWLPLPFPASQPFQASPGSLSFINHFHRNVWLRICFWENLISEALGRLLPFQLCTSLMAILCLKLALYRKKNLLAA